MPEPGHERPAPVPIEDQRRRWRAGDPVPVEAYLAADPTLAANTEAVLDLIYQEVLLREEQGESPREEEYLRRFPQYEELLRRQFFVHLALGSATPTSPPVSDAAATLPFVGSGTGLTTASPGDRGAGSEPAAGAPRVPGYEVLCELGRGGMGVVYKARQLGLNRLVALKMIRDGALAGPQERQRFQVEAEAVARLDHPNVVQIYEVGEDQGLPYFSLEFCGGGSLAGKLAGKTLPDAEGAALAETLARAIQACHQRGVVHRDLKPANVLLTGEGVPKLTDFGLAKRLEAGAAHTQSGAVLGTPSYMAPEQAEGHVHDIGPLTDVYALGAILYECLTGQPPFKAATFLDTLRQVTGQDPVPPSRLRPGVARDLEIICLRCLAKDPRHRYSSALALAQDLERFRAGEPILGRPEGRLRRLWRKARRRPVTMAILAAGLLAFVLAGALGSAALRAHRNTHEIAELTQRIQTGLDRPEWTPAYLDAMEDCLGRLRPLGPAQAGYLRERLYQRYAESVRAALHQAHLTPADIARIEAGLEVLRGREPDLAASLEATLRKRRETWEPVAELVPPFDNLATAFDPAAVRIAPEGLFPTPPGGSPAEPVVKTRLECAGNTRLEVVFHPSWESARQVGLGLDSDPGSAGAAGQERSPPAATGYLFLLRPPPGPPDSATTTLGTARKAGPLRAQLWRSGVLQREREVSVEAGPLRLRAQREGLRLTFQVNGLDPVEFDEVFPLGGNRGVCGVVWPGGVAVQKLRAEHKAPPLEPSPLEHGDACYAAGDFTGALSHYGDQARAGLATEAGQEARCKEALCLLALRRQGEAEKLLEALAGEPGRRWPVLAACQLWLLRLRQDRHEEADALFTTLSSHYKFEELAGIIPADVRGQILAVYGRHETYHLLLHDANRLHRLERMAAVQKFLRAPAASQAETRLLLLQAFLVADQPERAAVLAGELLADSSVSYPVRLVAIEMQVWVMLRAGKAAQALAAVDRWLAAPPGGPAAALPLRVERARALAALGRWDEAEQEVEKALKGTEQFLKGAPLADRGAVPDAWLVLGFLRERRGDAPGALQAWRSGLARVKAWKGYGSLSFAVLGSLTGDLSEADAEKLLAEVTGGIAGHSPVGAALGNRVIPVPVLAAVLRETWRGPRGRDWTRRMAFHDISYLDYQGIQAPLTMTEAVRQGAFGGKPSAEEDALAWGVCQDIYRDVTTGEIRESQLFQGCLAWTGTAGFLGWGGLAPTLPPRIRGPLAYVLGHRFLGMGKRDDAVAAFRTAVADGPPDSPLCRLAQAQLDRLGRKAAPPHPR
jgi:tRNA A-37 threonylcarbamoyl transferase component Bud32/tetratricopeptide (TPR) repeat protein